VGIVLKDTQFKPVELTPKLFFFFFNIYASSHSAAVITVDFKAGDMFYANIDTFGWYTNETSVSETTHIYNHILYVRFENIIDKCVILRIENNHYRYLGNIFTGGYWIGGDLDVVDFTNYGSDVPVVGVDTKDGNGVREAKTINTALPACCLPDYVIEPTNYPLENPVYYQDGIESSSLAQGEHNTYTLTSMNGKIDVTVGTSYQLP